MRWPICFAIFHVPLLLYVQLLIFILDSDGLPTFSWLLPESPYGSVDESAKFFYNELISVAARSILHKSACFVCRMAVTLVVRRMLDAPSREVFSPVATTGATRIA